MSLSISARIAAAKRNVERIEEDRPRFLKRIAEYGAPQQKLAIKVFEQGLREAKRELDDLLAKNPTH